MPEEPHPPRADPRQGLRSDMRREVDEDLAAAVRRGVVGLLGIETVQLEPARVVLRLAVDERVHQPFGVLHGGVSALLAETAASFGAALAAPPGHSVVGIELNASHLRPMREGVLTAVATPVRVGRSVQVWEITLTEDPGREICRARCTLAVRSTTDGGGSPPRPPD
ncbi:MAG: hotdog fold thioesterase [Acidimicrobiales bacterium]